VRFRWNAEQSEHERSWVGEPGESDLLAELELDCDALGLLPAGPVERGDAWDIEVDAFELLLGPSGDLHMEPEEDEEDLERELMDQLDGSVRGTYRGTREQDGRKLAVIFLEAKLRAEVEGEPHPSEEDIELEEGEKLGLAQESLKMELECSGELLWDVAAGHMAAVELTGDLLFESRDTQQLELPDGSTGEMAQIAVVRGDFDHRAEYRAAD